MSFEAQKHKVCVIGSGLAGLTAAYRLQEMGLESQIFEARNRPGGRVLTAQVGKSFEELGGKNFLDGGDPIHSLKLFRDLGLIPLHYKLPYYPLYIHGGQIYPLFEILWSYRDIEGLLDKMEKIASTSQNLQEVINGTFEDEDLQLIFTGAMRNYEGSDPQHLDATSFDSLYKISSIFIEAMNEAHKGHSPTMPWLTIRGGNAQLPLALNAGLKNKITYSHTLTSISKVDQKIVLKFNNEHVVQAEIVLLALPCSVIEDIHISPDVISQSQLDRFREVQYGTNAKILFSYSQIENTHDIFATPSFASWSNNDDNVRTLYLGGEYGRLDLKKARTLLDQGAKIIRAINPKVTLKSNILVLAKDTQYVVYKECVYKSWADDPFSKGSYINRAPGTSKWLNEIEVIKDERVRKTFRPIDDKIFFAGEHTTVLDAFGTMEGAVESGDRMARLIYKTLTA